MAYLSGSPLYNYELAMELKRQGHDVTIITSWKKGPYIDNENALNMFRNMLMSGIHIIEILGGKFDLAIISQMEDKDVYAIDCPRIINVIHSEYDCETPCLYANEWVAIRPSIKEHLIKEHSVPDRLIRVIYNGIDFNRFKECSIIDMKYNVVIPCTLDPLREKFLNWYIDKASPDFNVYIYGNPCGAVLHINEYAHINPSRFDIEEAYKGASLVAGILLGRVNLEARAMGILSRIHNPDNPDEFEEYYPTHKEFEKMHNIKNTAKQIIEKI